MSTPAGVTQHTPGPWTLTTVTTSVGICYKIGPFPWKRDEQNHACIYADYPGAGAFEDELLANARLIAAAPELLAALLEAQHTLDHIAVMSRGTARERLDYMTAERARAVVAKATKP